MGEVNKRMEEIIKREKDEINRSFLRDFVKQMRITDMKNKLNEEKYVREKMNKVANFTEEQLELMDQAFEYRIEYLRLSDIEKI